MEQRKKIQENENKSLVLEKYLYDKSQESRTIIDEWSKFMDSKEFINRSLDFTGVITGTGRFNRELVVETNKQFFNRLHSWCFTRKRKQGRQLQRFVVIEEGERHHHSHMLIECPIHLSGEVFKSLILDCWSKTTLGKNKTDWNSFSRFKGSRINSNITKETGKFSLGFGGYTLKQLRTKTDIVDTDNSYWV